MRFGEVCVIFFEALVLSGADDGFAFDVDNVLLLDFLTEARLSRHLGDGGAAASGARVSLHGGAVAAAAVLRCCVQAATSASSTKICLPLAYTKPANAQTDAYNATTKYHRSYTWPKKVLSASSVAVSFDARTTWAGMASDDGSGLAAPPPAIVSQAAAR
jgi:hypothetical protein